MLILAGGIPAQDPGPPPGGGPGMWGPRAEDRKVVKTYDADKNGRLNAAERAKAREALKAERASRPARGPGGFGPGREQREPAKSGVRVSPEDVKPVPEGVPLYDGSVLRTLFLTFEADDWEDELADFVGTDVEVPATLTVDGRRYPGVGVSFRGASSLMGVGKGWKRSFNVSIDAADGKQRLLGYKTLNLLNGHSDPSFLHTVLASEITRHYFPAPKANLARVVVNGESWGVYVNAQQYDRVMAEEVFKTSKGARWKASGSPQARGGLESFGDTLSEYQRRFELKGADNTKKAWADLVKLCRVLNETPLEELEARLAPILDLENVLEFLALDVVLANGDGYWVRASDYALFEDPSGRFHLLPHDLNETFGGGGGPPGRRGPRGGDSRPEPGERPGGPGGPPIPGAQGGPRLDPLVGLDDARKPLRSRLLAVPALRERYLRHVRDVAEQWLDWNRLGPIVARYRALIDREVELDTRKLATLEAFRRMTADEPPPALPESRGERGLTLRAFADQRRRYLLEHPQIRALGAGGPAKAPESR
jgi:CotH kinase protein